MGQQCCGSDDSNRMDIKENQRKFSRLAKFQENEGNCSLTQQQLKRLLLTHTQIPFFCRNRPENSFFVYIDTNKLQKQITSMYNVQVEGEENFMKQPQHFYGHQMGKFRNLGSFFNTRKGSASIDMMPIYFDLIEQYKNFEEFTNTQYGHSKKPNRSSLIHRQIPIGSRSKNASGLRKYEENSSKQISQQSVYVFYIKQKGLAKRLIIELRGVDTIAILDRKIKQKLNEQFQENQLQFQISKQKSVRGQTSFDLSDNQAAKSTQMSSKIPTVNMDSFKMTLLEKIHNNIEQKSSMQNNLISNNDEDINLENGFSEKKEDNTENSLNNQQFQQQQPQPQFLKNEYLQKKQQTLFLLNLKKLQKSENFKNDQDVSQIQPNLSYNLYVGSKKINIKQNLMHQLYQYFPIKADKDNSEERSIRLYLYQTGLALKTGFQKNQNQIQNNNNSNLSYQQQQNSVMDSFASEMNKSGVQSPKNSTQNQQDKDDLYQNDENQCAGEVRLVQQKKQSSINDINNKKNSLQSRNLLSNLDFYSNSMEQQQFKEYRRVKQGINLEIECGNEHCKLFQKRQILRIKESILDLLKCKFQQKCQECAKLSKIIFIGIYRAKYSFLGVFQIGKKYGGLDVQYVGDCYYLIDVHGINLENFKSYKLLCYIDGWEQRQNLAIVQKCGICLEELLFEEHRYDYCLHCFHKKCFDKLPYKLQDSCYVCNDQ